MYNLNVTRVRKKNIIQGIIFTIIGAGTFWFSFSPRVQSTTSSSIILFIMGVLTTLAGIMYFKDRTVEETVRNVTTHEKELTTKDAINYASFVGGENDNHKK